MAESQKSPALPVFLTDDDLQANPKFAQLMSILSKKISLNGTSIHYEKEVEQAQINLSKARYSWLMSHVPHYELNELAMDFEIKGVERMLTAEEEQFKDVLSQSLATSEIEDHLSIYSNPTSGSTLFGLTQADVDRHNPVKHLLPALQQAALPMLEDRLRKKCEEMYDFFSTCSQPETASDKLLLAKAHTLPHLIETKQQELAQDKTRLKEAKTKKDEHFLLYYQTLLECLATLESLIERYKLKCQHETDQIVVKALEAQCAVTHNKSALAQLQVICDTYTPETTKALKVVGRHLDDAIIRTERELTSTQQALNAYHSLGPDFKLLVEEYTHLKTEIDNCRWGLQHFLKSERKQTDDHSSQGLDQDLARLTDQCGGITLHGAGHAASSQADEESGGAFGGGAS